jgi:large subunit ribosomal protein L24
MKIRKGDNVVMLSGKDRGKKAKIVAVIPETGKVFVEGLNMMKRHTKPRQQGQAGQIISKERAVSVASVALVCKSCGKQTRVGYLVEGDTKTRICKKCKNTVQ